MSEATLPRAAARLGVGEDTRARGRAGGRWPLVAIVLLAALLRLGTLDLQSLWYDEAFTPVHVLHPSLSATWSSFVHSENTPPLWYLLEWPITRALGTGAVALRLLSALAGIAAVIVGWAIGCELAGRRAAIVCAALLAVNPLFVWYSQEARAYGLFVLMAALALLCFLRALREPTPRRVWAFAIAGSLALLTHYFALFLLVPMIAGLGLRLLGDMDFGLEVPRGRPPNPRKIAALAPLALPVLVGVALIPLIVAQGGHGTQWIGEWALASRLEAVPQYYLTGYTGSALGHGIELLVALAILAGVLFGLWRTLTQREERAALIVLVVAACGVLIPLLLALFGADYLAPRNLVGAMVPVSALLAVVIAARRAGAVGMVLAGLVLAAFLALTIDVDLSPRLQRGDWRGVADALRSQPSLAPRAIVTVELGAAPLEYYLPPLTNLGQGARVALREVIEVGYAPLRSSARTPPAAGLRLASTRDVHGLFVYRFTSSVPVRISEFRLHESTIADAPRPEVLVPGSFR